MNEAVRVRWHRIPTSTSGGRGGVVCFPCGGARLAAACRFSHRGLRTVVGVWKAGAELVETRRLMDTGYRIKGGFDCDRAFKNILHDDDLAKVHDVAAMLWGNDVTVIDPMAGSGFIPLEAARLGSRTLANGYNPVACSVLEATVDYPLRFGVNLAEKACTWAKVWGERIEKRLAPLYPAYRFAKVHASIFARAVPCLDTQHHTPFVPDWHLLKPKTEHGHIVAEPIVHKKRGPCSVRICELGKGAGQLREAPLPT